MTSTTSDSSTASAEPITEPSSAFTHYVLRQIECAKVRAELVANQADMALAALSGGLISPEMAILILAETDVEVSS
jgi:hypothetical protein